MTVTPGVVALILTTYIPEVRWNVKEVTVTGSEAVLAVTGANDTGIAATGANDTGIGVTGSTS